MYVVGWCKAKKTRPMSESSPPAERKLLAVAIGSIHTWESKAYYRKIHADNHLPATADSNSRRMKISLAMSQSFIAINVSAMWREDWRIEIDTEEKSYFEIRNVLANSFAKELILLFHHRH